MTSSPSEIPILGTPNVPTVNAVGINMYHTFNAEHTASQIRPEKQQTNVNPGVASQ